MTKFKSFAVAAVLFGCTVFELWQEELSNKMRKY
jgi:hypothetical protein